MFQQTGRGKRGFTLIELAIVLTIAGLLFVGLWRLLSGGNQQVRDQSAGSQQQQLITAVKGYLASAQDSFLSKLLAQPASTVLALPAAGTNTSNANCRAGLGVNNPGLCDFLPSGFDVNTPNSYGQTYSIRVKRNDTSTVGNVPSSYSFMIVTTLGDTIPDASGGRISAYIGGDGGFIYSTNVCNVQAVVAASNLAACGAYGTWAASTGVGSYGFPATTVGHIASRSYVSPSADNLLPWLARLFMPSDPQFTWNTMQADLYMGGASAQTPGTASNIYLYPPLGSSAINPGATFPGAIFLQGGSIQDGADPSNTSFINMDSKVPLNVGNGFVTLNTRCTADPTLTAGNLSNGLLVEAGAACKPGLQLNGDGNITGMMQAFDFFAANFIYQGSDMRLKKNIKPLVNPLDDIMQLKPVSFTFKSSDREGLGVIAQDVEKVYPQLVTKGPGMKAVAYEGLIAPLIGAVQELKKENDQLRQELADQKMRQQKLENELHRSNAP